MKQNDFHNKTQEIFNKAKDDSSQFSEDEIIGGMPIAIIAYIGIFSIVSYAVCGDNRFARYHARQGLKLLIFEVIVSILVVVLEHILPFLTLVHIIQAIAGICFFALSVLGIINAINGKVKELPIVS